MVILIGSSSLLIPAMLNGDLAGLVRVNLSVQKQNVTPRLIFYYFVQLKPINNNYTQNTKETISVTSSQPDFPTPSS